MGPHRGEGWAGLVSEHVISRTVRDSAALLDITHGADTGAYSIITPPARSYAEETRRPPGKLRVIYTAKLFAGQYLHPENEKALHRLLKLLEAQGHISPRVRHFMNLADSSLRQLTLQHWETAQQFTRDFARQSGDADLWITPTLAEPPVDLGVLAMTNPDFTDYLHKQARFSPYTSLFNFTGQPRLHFLSIPLRTDCRLGYSLQPTSDVKTCCSACVLNWSGKSAPHRRIKINQHAWLSAFTLPTYGLSDTYRIMGKIGIFYGSTTGNTEAVAEQIQNILGKSVVDIFDVESASAEDVEKYDNLIFGIPTWNIERLQEDWEDFILLIEKGTVSLKNKKIAFFGAGDQEGYPDTFGDAIGIVYDIVSAQKGIPVCTDWPTDGYNFEESKALRNGNFVGLLTDEDNQPKLTDERVKKVLRNAENSIRYINHVNPASVHLNKNRLYPSGFIAGIITVKKIALTGVIGSGKSFVGEHIRSLGYEVLQADIMAKSVAAAHLPEIAELLGQDVIAPG
ncbi:hypothetical protein CHS0354_026804 [Potamilus streckersoni]|uniref:Flavodoxin-like domain-containing protein n=1 Tax=Potamilus streckersoni TaxID=2493646 RepID=A0AAE0W8D6_9BIVA|nr:hypothetical protein CHS0354_026804 [Potamilus streckersoni]